MYETFNQYPAAWRTQDTLHATERWQDGYQATNHEQVRGHLTDLTTEQELTNHTSTNEWRTHLCTGSSCQHHHRPRRQGNWEHAHNYLNGDGPQRGRHNASRESNYRTRMARSKIQHTFRYLSTNTLGGTSTSQHRLRANPLDDAIGYSNNTSTVRSRWMER